MYRDNSLMPKEAVRLVVLGTLIQGGPLRYADLAGSVRHFLDRMMGPSLDLMGTSLEMLRYEGLIEALDGSGMEDNALLGPTEAGRAEFDTLISTLRDTLGLTVFMVTHDLDSLHTICNRIAVLADKHVLVEGTLEDMLKFDHPWVQAYFHGSRARGIGI